MAKMRDNNYDPMDTVRRYAETGENPPPEERVEAVLGTMRQTLLNALYRNCEGVEIALATIYSELSPRDWVNNGLWQDMFDHILVTQQALGLAELLQRRMTTDQIWMIHEETLVLGVGFTLWNEEQVEVLPQGSVIRWQDENGEFVVGVQVRPFVWQVPGKSAEVQPKLPAIILAAPGDADDFAFIDKVYGPMKDIREQEGEF